MSVRGGGRPVALGRRRRGTGVLAAAVLVVAACSGGDGDTGDGDSTREVDETRTESGSPPTTDVLDNPRWANVVRGPEASDAEPARGGSVVMAVEDPTDTFAPWQSTAGPPNANEVFAIFDPLVTRDANGELRPYLAKSIEPNEDFTQWTLTLREGARFHDGTPLDAQALKRNWDDYLAAEGSFTASTANRFVQRLEVVDELTVRYMMTEADPTFPRLLELQLGWPFSPDAADRDGDAFGQRPVGTGPFRFVSWVRDSELVVERNRDYWQPELPYLDRVTFRLIPDAATRAATFAAGDVDAVQGKDLSELAADVASVDDARVVLGTGTGARAMLFNTETPPTNDVRIRRSLAHAVDQQALLEVAAGEAAALSEPRSQFFPRDSPFYSEAVAEAWLTHDPDQAGELYEDYINDPDRSDGKEVDEPVSVSIVTLNTPGFVELAQAYQGFYEQVGYEVELEPQDRAGRISAAVSGDYQLNIIGVGQDTSPLGEFQFYLGDPADTITNFTGFYDQTVIDALKDLRSAGSLDEQAALTEELGLHLANQVPWQWLGSDLPLIAAKDNVRGLRSWTLPDGSLGDGVAPGGSTFWSQAWLAP